MREYPKIYVAGHAGMVGSAIKRYLLAHGHPRDRLVTRLHRELDLTDQLAVRAFLKEHRPDQIYLAAAKVGGIKANNTFPADFAYQNLIIETNVIDAAFRAGIKKLLFLGSSCIYPSLAPQPMSEEALLTGPLEATNEPYAIAKIAGIKLCESYNRQYGKSNGIDYRSVMPTNLYGPGDNYHAENSHVIPGLIRRIHWAKESELPHVVVWGSGKPLREFLYVEDLASACVRVMNLDPETFSKVTLPMRNHINVGSGIEVSIHSLSKAIANVVGYNGRLVFDSTKPDGAPRKLLDSSRIQQIGWRADTSLERGLELAYRDFLDSRPSAKRGRG